MQAKIFVLGFVQGVGLRRFVKKNAENLNIKGWVKNLPDGRVEAVLNGDKENIEKLLEIIKKGSFFAEVKSILINYEKEEKFSDFKIVK